LQNGSIHAFRILNSARLMGCNRLLERLVDCQVHLSLKALS
jgi:hypothetical protein